MIDRLSPMKATVYLLACSLSAQTITTVIGTGKPGFDDTSINNPYGIVIGPDGGLYIGEIGNHVIRRLDLKTKEFTTIVAAEQGLNEPYEMRFDHGGNLIYVDMKNNNVMRVNSKDKSVTVVAGPDAQFKQPHSIAFHPAGDLLVCDIGNNRVRRIKMNTGTVDTFLSGPEIKGPRAIDFDSQGNLYLVLREGNAVYRVDKDLKLTRVAGTGQKGFSGDGGPAINAALNGPKGIAIAGRSMYLADTENHAIREVDLDSGVITTVVGTGERGDGPDGDPAKCKLNRPHGVFVSRDGTLYIADSESHRIRALSVH